MISLRLAKTLNGDVRLIHSTPGHGSRFRLTIQPKEISFTPTCLLNPGTYELVKLDNPFPNSLADDDSLHDVRILYVEDGPDNQRLVAHILKKAGADVTVVENGLIGLEEFESELEKGKCYNVVLMDMQMPVMDGYEATRELRARRL